MRSISKSIVGLLVGIALQQGKIASVATPALDFYPEYAHLRSSVRDAVHRDHLLTMSSGFEWDGGCAAERALDGGRWRDQPIVPAAWIAESLRPHISTKRKSPPTATDAMHDGDPWWTGTVEWHGRKLAWGAAFGNGGPRLFVVPDLDLTVVITAGDHGSQEIAHTANRLFEQVIGTVEP